MKIFIILTGVFAVTQTLTLCSLEQQQWKLFKLTYGKKYETEAEEMQRMEIFFDTLRQIEEHNKKFEAGLVTYKKGVNQFTDMTNQQFRKTLTPMEPTKISAGIVHVPSDNSVLPASIDWREKGVVGLVENLGENMSSWIIAAAGALEGQFAIKAGIFRPVSKENIRDCWRKVVKNGTEGSLATAFEYVKLNGGIDSTDSYGNPCADGQCCYNPAGSIGKINGYVTIKGGDEEELKSAVATIGPVSVTINMGPLINYTGGVFQGDCDPTELNHCLLVVGYGTTNDGTDYWILKNSWGEKYGENGYIRLVRNVNQCGIAAAAAYPYI